LGNADHCSLRTRIGVDRVKRAWDYVYSHGCIGKQSPFLEARNMANTSGFIFHTTTGEQIAWIVGTDVFSVETKKKFATLRGTELYSLAGEFLGVHVAEAGAAQGDKDSTAIERFTKLAKNK
jgi:hypothetical protein